MVEVMGKNKKIIIGILIALIIVIGIVIALSHSLKIKKSKGELVE